MPPSTILLRPGAAAAILVLACLAAVLGLCPTAGAADVITLPPQTVAPGQVNLTVKVVLPPGHKFNPEAPSSLRLSSQDQKVLKVKKTFAKSLTAANLPVKLKVPAKPGQTTLQAELKLNFCNDQGGLCFMRDATVELPVQVAKDAPGKVLEILYEVKVP